MDKSIPTVVVATWGNPLFWRDAIYVCGNVEVDSCSAIVSLLKFLIDTKGLTQVKRFYLLGLDSIVDVDRAKFDRYRGLCADAFKDCYNRFYEQLKPNSYTSVLTVAENIYRCVLNRVLTDSKCNYEGSGEKAKRCFSEDEVKHILENTSIVVLPATGSPGGKWVFKGCPEDYLARALPIVIRDALKSSNNYKDGAEVVFDATHGINYTPTLTLRLVELLAQFMRLKYKVDVEIKVYNSDPYPPDRPPGDMPRLNVNLVYETHVTEIEIPVVEKSPKVLKSCKQLGEPQSETIKKVIEEFNNRHKSIYGLIRNVASSMYSPAPLALLYACHLMPEHASKILEGAIDSALETWMRNIVIENTNAGPLVKRHLSIDSATIWGMLLCLTTCQYINEIIQKSATTTKIIGNMLAFNHEVLQRVADDLYGKVYSSMKYLINQELSEINLFVKELRDQGASGCYKYTPRKGEQADKTSSELDKQKRKDVIERIIVAHAALPYNYVDVCLEDNNIYLKYSDEDGLTTVLNKLKQMYDNRGNRQLSSKKNSEDYVH